MGKSRIPSPIGGSIQSGNLIASGLQFEKGLYARRYQINEDILEHRVYISRTVLCKLFPFFAMNS